MAESTEKLTKLGQLKLLAEKLSKEVKILEDIGGEPNKIEKIKVNDSEQSISPGDKSVNIKVPTKVSELNNDSKYQTEEQVNAKVSAVYKPGGSVEFGSLPTASQENLGYVYNVTDDFTTTEDFVEGAGNKYPKGTNVVIVESSGSYKYDVLAGFVDLTGYVKKQEGKDLSSNDYTNEEKGKLAGIEENANNYTHPTSEVGAKISGLYKVATDAEGHIIAADVVKKDDITKLGIPEQDTTYAAVTPKGTDGLMTGEDKAKLDGMEIASDEEVESMLAEIFDSAG